MTSARRVAVGPGIDELLPEQIDKMIAAESVMTKDEEVSRWAPR